jgi:hypothetical protein
MKQYESLLNAIKNERRANLGKRFNRWITAQWGYERGSFNKWRVDGLRAIREITESILLDPNNEYYFVYKDNKLQSSHDDIPFGNIIHIDVLVFKELLRDYRLKEILDVH